MGDLASALHLEPDMPYLILPKTATPPDLYVDPGAYGTWDIWEPFYSGRRSYGMISPCPGCAMPIFDEAFVFGFGDLYLCARCSVRKFLADAARAVATYPTRTLAYAASNPQTDTVHFVPTKAERRTWQEREYQRMNTTYTPIPFGDLWRDASAPIYSRYLHFAQSKPGYFSYTKNDVHGHEDLQTVVKPGRYLAQYHADMPEARKAEIIAQCAAYVSGTYGLATTVADITTIYNTAAGPNSCMRRKNSSVYEWQKHFDAGHFSHHPCAVYAAELGSDLAVAYYGPLTSVSQRAVVWPAKKQFLLKNGAPNIYGTGPLLSLLQRDGYQSTTQFTGARIARLPYKDGVLLPYIDGSDQAYPLTPTQLILDDAQDPDDKGYSAQETCGYAGADDADSLIEEAECDVCGGTFDADDLRNGECEDCRNSWTCEHCDGRYSGNESSFDIDGQSWCESCAESDSRCCEDCNELFRTDRFSRPQRQVREQTETTGYCLDCADHYAYCDECAERYDRRESATCPNEHESVTPDVCPATSDRYALEYWSSLGVWRITFQDIDSRVMVGTFEQCERRREYLLTHNPTAQYRIVPAPLVALEVSAHV